MSAFPHLLTLWFYVIERPIQIKNQLSNTNTPVKELLTQNILQFELTEEPIGGLFFAITTYHEGKEFSLGDKTKNDKNLQYYDISDQISFKKSQRLLGGKASSDFLGNNNFRLMLNRNDYKIRAEIIFAIRNAIPGFYTVNMKFLDRFGQVFVDYNLLFRVEIQRLSDVNTEADDLNFTVGEFDPKNAKISPIFKAASNPTEAMLSEENSRSQMIKFLDWYYL